MYVLPKDIRYKIFNKVPLTLLKLYEFSDDYMKSRTLELYNIQNFHSEYLPSYQKFIQISSLNGDISQGSLGHIPDQTLVLGLVKFGEIPPKNILTSGMDLNFRSLVKTRNKTAILDTLETILKYIKELPKNIPIGPESFYNVGWSDGVSNDLYDQIFELFMQYSYPLSEDIVGIAVSVQLIEKYKNRLNKLIVLVQSSYSMDISRFRTIKEILSLTDEYNYEGYILDEFTDLNNTKDELLVVFSCYKTLRKKGYKNLEGNHHTNIPIIIGSNWFNIAPRVSRERGEIVYRDLLTAFGENPRSGFLRASLEYWNWILYGTEYIKGNYPKGFKESFKAYKAILNNYVFDTGNPETIKNWIRESGVPYNLDLLNYPQIFDVVAKELSHVKGPLFIRILNNFYSKSLYLAAFKFMSFNQTITYVPDIETLNEYSSKIKEKYMVSMSDPCPSLLEAWIAWEKYRIIVQR